MSCGEGVEQRGRLGRADSLYGISDRNPHRAATDSGRSDLAVLHESKCRLICAVFSGKSARIIDDGLVFADMLPAGSDSYRR